jgi:hypothetical protein
MESPYGPAPTITTGNIELDILRVLITNEPTSYCGQATALRVPLEILGAAG